MQTYRPKRGRLSWVASSFTIVSIGVAAVGVRASVSHASSKADSKSTRCLTRMPGTLRHRQSGPTLKFVTSICTGVRAAVGFPWSNGFDYDPEPVQYAADFALHAASLGLQELLQLLEFGD
jgi:hypothetical protein